ncbi:MAG TPA: glutamine amidotransferase [Roseiflexaceae bacterium]|nr:glutamine amidotransferase [Roseiflexaceae bacterium]
MARTLRILIAGESWETLSFHQKGFDVFTTTFYYEGVGPLRAALEAAGHTVEYQPSHIAATRFPTDQAELQTFDVVMLSDIGANTLLLHPDTFERSRRMTNRLSLLQEYVRAGGGLVMVGGYLTFQGIDAKGRYRGTPVEAALPVTLLDSDDRVEVPEGAIPQVVAAQHPIVAGLEATWPHLLGYNRLIARPEATTIATVGSDPLLAAWEHGSGRAVAFASDCGPHWAPPEFLAWSGYGLLWAQLVEWAGGAR